MKIALGVGRKDGNACSPSSCSDRGRTILGVRGGEHFEGPAKFARDGDLQPDKAAELANEIGELLVGAENERRNETLQCLMNSHIRTHACLY